MRIKTFTAATMAEAMEQVREELGADAIIISTQRGSGSEGIRITAAREEADNPLSEDPDASPLLPLVIDRLTAALGDQAVPAALTEKLLNAVPKASADPVEACIDALKNVFSFKPLPEDRHDKVFMMIGPPGCGKSMTVAKLATRARLASRRLAVFSADNKRAGAAEQLNAFTEILDIDLQQARTPEALLEGTRDIMSHADLAFIDTPGLNPFFKRDMQLLSALTDSDEIEPVLVLPAGGDPVELAEMADIFSRTSGARSLLLTRMDVTRRFGPSLHAAYATGLTLTDMSINPHVATGLHPLSPEALTALILPPDADDEKEVVPPEAEIWSGDTSEAKIWNGDTPGAEIWDGDTTEADDLFTFADERKRP